MRGMTLTGVLLVALGLVLLAGPVFTYTKHEKVVDVGPIEVTAANRKHVSLPPVAKTTGLRLYRASVALHPRVDFALRLVAVVAVALLHKTDQLFRLALHLIEIVVGQLAPLRASFAFQLAPLALQDI